MPALHSRSIVLWLFSSVGLMCASSADRVHADERRSCLFVLDGSGSMQGRPHELLVEGFAAALSILEDGTQAWLSVFNHEPRRLCELSPLDDRRRELLVEAVRRRKPDGGTSILAAVADALDQRTVEGDVVLVSDGVETGNSAEPVPEEIWRPKAEALTARARAGRIRIHVLAVGPVAANDLSTLLASATGGELLRLDGAEQLPASMVQLAAQLGRFWLCERATEFRLAAPTEVVEIGPAGQKSSLLGAGIATSAEAAHASLRSGSLGVVHRRLTAGDYRFAPSRGATPVYLLRRMKWKWTLPNATETAAGRRFEFVVQATPDSATEPFALGEMRLTARLRQGDLEMRGQVSLGIKSPSQAEGSGDSEHAQQRCKRR